MSILANVIFYLKGTRVCFETDLKELPDWETCKKRLKDLLGKPVGHDLAAKTALASRAQTPT